MTLNDIGDSGNALTVAGVRSVQKSLVKLSKGQNHAQVATGNVQWTFVGGCLNYMDVFL